jgi:halocyanin-like protein
MDWSSAETADEPTRRTLLRGLALAGVLGSAGCVSGADPGGAPAGDGNSSASGTPTDTPTATPTDTPTATPTDTPTDVDDVDAWLADANGYHGDVQGRFGDQTQVRVATRPTEEFERDSDFALAFNPPGIRVTPGTTVVWEWTEHPGEHNVVALDGTFDSGEASDVAGLSFEYTFEEEGVVPYVCEPHRDDGMIGAVVVREAPSTGYPRVDEWLAGVDRYDGTVTDRTGVDRTTVTAGAEGNGGHFSFAPLVTKVSEGTTVAWEWSGHGGAHNVAFDETGDAVDADPVEVQTDPGVHYEHTFADAGVYLYYCEPHRAIGGRGAIVVE